MGDKAAAKDAEVGDTGFNDVFFEMEDREVERVSSALPFTLPREGVRLNEEGGTMLLGGLLGLEDREERMGRFASGAGADEETDSASLIDSGR